MRFEAVTPFFFLVPKICPKVTRIFRKVPMFIPFDCRGRLLGLLGTLEFPYFAHYLMHTFRSKISSIIGLVVFKNKL